MSLRVMASHLVADWSSAWKPFVREARDNFGLTRPGDRRRVEAGEHRDPINPLSRDDIEALCDKDPAWEALLEVHAAQPLLMAALAKFEPFLASRMFTRQGALRSLHIQAVLVRRQVPGGAHRASARERNTKFHSLLLAASPLFSDLLARNRTWNPQQERAVERIRKMRPSRS